MSTRIDPTFFADVFSRKVIEHADHAGYYSDDVNNLRCLSDDELVTPSPEWLRDGTAPT